MADEPGRRPVGFSVAPETVTVTTNEGATVTLVRTGVQEVDGTPTMGAYDTNGDWYPLVVNESLNVIAIGFDWDETSGADVSDTGSPFVAIIDDDNSYLNPQLLSWLINKGATFDLTFPGVFIKSNTNQEMSQLTGYSCHTGDNMQIDGNGSPGESYIYGVGSENLLNCAGDGYGDTAWASGDFPVSADSEQTDAYNNYLVLKALGVPMSIIES